MTAYTDQTRFRLTESLHYVRRADSQKGHIEEQENARPQVRGKISSPIMPATKTQVSGGKKKAGRTVCCYSIVLDGPSDHSAGRYRHARHDRQFVRLSTTSRRTFRCRLVSTKSLQCTTAFTYGRFQSSQATSRWRIETALCCCEY